MKLKVFSFLMLIGFGTVSLAALRSVDGKVLVEKDGFVNVRSRHKLLSYLKALGWNKELAEAFTDIQGDINLESAKNYRKLFLEGLHENLKGPSGSYTTSEAGMASKRAATERKNNLGKENKKFDDSEQFRDLAEEYNKQFEMETRKPSGQKT